MGDIIVLSIVGVYVLAVFMYLNKDKKRGVSAVCKGCSISRTPKNKQGVPIWVNEYQKKHNQ